MKAKSRGLKPVGELMANLKLNLSWGYGFCVPPVASWGLRQVPYLLGPSQWNTPGI